jgi:hypothetical protein
MYLKSFLCANFQQKKHKNFNEFPKSNELFFSNKHEAFRFSQAASTSDESFNEKVGSLMVILARFNEWKSLSQRTEKRELFARVAGEKKVINFQ